MVKIRYNRFNLFECCGVKFLPGLNHVDDSDYGKVKNHQTFVDKLEKGLFEIHGEVKRQSKKSLIKDIGDLYDMSELRKLAKDKRKDVAEAAQNQIDLIDEAGE